MEPSRNSTFNNFPFFVPIFYIFDKQIKIPRTCGPIQKLPYKKLFVWAMLIWSRPGIQLLTTFHFLSLYFIYLINKSKSHELVVQSKNFHTKSCLSGPCCY